MQTFNPYRDNDIIRESKGFFFFAKDKASIAAAEVFNSVVLEFCSQKQKAVQLIPGADVKQFLGEGDDVIQTHVESGITLT